MVEPSILNLLERTRAYQMIRFRMNKQLSKFLEEQVIKDSRGMRTAEVACGSGFSAHLLAQRMGVSLSIAGDLNLEDYLDAKIKDFKACFVRMDIYRPPIQPDSLDLVWNSSSLEELTNATEALQAMRRIAKPGGFIFVGVPNLSGLPGLLRLIPDEAVHTWIGNPYSRSELRQLINSAGLKIEKEITYLLGTFIGVLARKL